jgi:hypothetical protein
MTRNKLCRTCAGFYQDNLGSHLSHMISGKEAAWHPRQPLLRGAPKRAAASLRCAREHPGRRVSDMFTLP